LEIFIPKLSKLDFLDVNLNTEVRDIYIFERDVAFNCVSGSISDVFESIEELFCPELEKLLRVLQYLACFDQVKLESFTLFDVEKVKVVLI